MKLLRAAFFGLVVTIILAPIINGHLNNHANRSCSQLDGNREAQRICIRRAERESSINSGYYTFILWLLTTGFRYGTLDDE